MKKLSMVLSAWLLAMLMMCNVTAGAVSSLTIEEGIVPYYNVIRTLTADLTINRSGKSTCSASVRTSPSGYSITLTCDLCKDGDVIKSWTASGKGNASLDKSWYVTSGSDYQVIASATVYDSAGNYVDSGTAYSSVVSY